MTMKLKNILLEGKLLKESGLSRIWKHMSEHDTGTITAFRHAKFCSTGTVYTKKENLQRNHSLLAKLMSKGYSVTAMKGSYIENYGSSDAKEVGENIFFVADIKDTGRLEKDLRKLGEEFEQDSILFIPKGGLSADLIGTNKCKNGFPGHGIKKHFSQRQLGKDGEFFSRVKGRPFVFKESITEYEIPEGFFARWRVDSYAKTHWSKL